MTVHAKFHLPFSGSYAAGDIDFLLKEVTIRTTDVAEKEALIQSGRKHYSEMISDEARPDHRYMQIFKEAWASSRDRIAGEVLSMAHEIRADIAAGKRDPRVTICSLVRAGAPLGVMLTRALREIDVDAVHYGISIIRDRGLDRNAIDHILEERPATGVVFVDGWTGKGAIAKELRKSWVEITGLQAFLVVLADPCGAADLAGSNEDWLIPTGILGANISGLISRTILNGDVIGPDDFHGFLNVGHLADIDHSAAFVDDIHEAMRDLDGYIPMVIRSDENPAMQSFLWESCKEVVKDLMVRFGTDNPNRIKPGLAEATRAVLRRRPHHVIVANDGDPDVQALLHLCRENGVNFTIEPSATGSYRAITIIEKAG